MDPRFNDIAADPTNSIFEVVFFPDRVYHAQYLNATRSSRYRYVVQEVRGKSESNILKGFVFIDGLQICNFLRIEARGGRLAEVVREKGRFMGPDIMANVGLTTVDDNRVDALVRMHFCPWIHAFQVELWETLDAPAGKQHDYQVLDMMGYHGPITKVPKFADALADLDKLKRVDLAFRENDVTYPSRSTIPDADVAWDNYYQRNVQVPNTQQPSSDQNTVRQDRYGVDFQRGWFVKKVRDIPPVRYRNGMMEAGNPDAGEANIIEMRWVLQQEFGGTVVFFHEVTIPPHTVEGTHQHIGSEELYYVFEGRGIAYMGAGDDPALADDPTIPVVERKIFGLDPRPCKKLDVAPGSVIYTKSGGIHGIENPYDEPLRFVAFLYHST
ncbi:cupin domain-containing protein [Bradyrhizobium sp. LMG 9283]|uniref:cupin domain-containing protein n=1 Tax=Bradyrhizobium sp. LMG 9283 TaxID=592064 RepID=UPI00388FD535